MSQPIAVFDFDGVLIKHDSTVEFVRRRIRRSPWLVVPMLPTAICYLSARRVPTARSFFAKALIGIVLAGRDVHSAERELRSLGRELGASSTWPLRDGVEAARAMAAGGHRVVVVSAGLTPLVRAFLDECGLQRADVIASGVSPAWSGSRMAPHNFHRRKVESVGRAGFAAPWAVVYSDSTDDLPLMMRAARVVLVNPSTTTSAAVREQVDAEVVEVRWV